MIMKARILMVLTSSLLLVVSTHGREFEEQLQEAKAKYDSGDRAAAKELYLIAARNGSPDAHFALASRYVIDEAESIHHFSEAARKGHQEALDYALDKLLFRAGSLKHADPARALAIYREAKLNNPGLRLHERLFAETIMELCVEPKPFDVKAFVERYGMEEYLEYDDHSFGYHVWQLAEEASRGGRFGAPDPELVFNLVMRGGVVPAEFVTAVLWAHRNWKNGTVEEFNICDHITSGVGGTHCALREAAEASTQWISTLDRLEEKFGEDLRQPLADASRAAFHFIERKAADEEGYDGTGRVSSIVASEIRQKFAYLDLIEKVSDGMVPESAESLAKAEQELGSTYEKILVSIGVNEETGYDTYLYRLSPSGLREVQDLWIQHRDASAKLFALLSPSIGEDRWKSWLTEKRIAELKQVIELLEE
jgi:uncharacterized protein YecT (DUF1311 family)